jgi:iron complex transport system ATP-binding protein
VDLSVRAGEVLAVIGPNGAGKSTLIRAISGTTPIQSGRVRVEGKDLAALSPKQRARRMAVVPQAHQLPAAFSVYELVLLGRTPYMNWMGSAGPGDHAQVRQALEETQTLELADRLVGELSGGEQQRVLLARALAQGSPLLLLDEPTTFLDLQHQSNLLNLVRRLASESRLAVLIVIHDLNLAARSADRVALLVNGSLQAAGAPRQVLTAERLAAVYGVPVHVIPHPDYGTPLILPDGRVAQTAPAGEAQWL